MNLHKALTQTAIDAALFAPLPLAFLAAHFLSLLPAITPTLSLALFCGVIIARFIFNCIGIPQQRPQRLTRLTFGMRCIVAIITAFIHTKLSFMNVALSGLLFNDMFNMLNFSASKVFSN